ncbi:hypothetical protein GW758_02180 [Candidatus Falkowbacteria bacterium]|nr:hypothetical protein [Candidatus Falkowbacteria bacterium]
MHVYIYDDYLAKGKYNKAINRMEIRITDLGLNGKILRLGGIKNVKAAIENEIRLGAKTIVAVGNNQTVNRIIGAIINADVYEEFQKNTVLGIIPIGDDTSIASSFGIKDEESACNVLLARRVKKIDLGAVGNFYFLKQLKIKGKGTTLKINNFEIEASDKAEINIINLLDERKDKLPKSSPYDGLLDVFIKGGRNDLTFLNSKKIIIENKNKEKILIDDILEIEAPAEVGILKSAITVIVGKERSFL